MRIYAWHIASLFGLTEDQALVVLFVLLPFAAAAVVVPLVAWRFSGGPKPVLTSEILATGDLGRGEIVSVRSLGSILDVRPMVRFLVRVSIDDEEPFELEVVQSVPRSLVTSFKPGDVVDVRVTRDRGAGAVVLIV